MGWLDNAFEDTITNSTDHDEGPEKNPCFECKHKNCLTLKCFCVSCEYCDPLNVKGCNCDSQKCWVI